MTINALFHYQFLEDNPEAVLDSRLMSGLSDKANKLIDGSFHYLDWIKVICYKAKRRFYYSSQQTKICTHLFCLVAILIFLSIFDLNHSRKKNIKFDDYDMSGLVVLRIDLTHAQWLLDYYRSALADSARHWVVGFHQADNVQLVHAHLTKCHPCLLRFRSKSIARGCTNMPIDPCHCRT